MHIFFAILAEKHGDWQKFIGIYEKILHFSGNFLVLKSNLAFLKMFV